jgi:extracellular matrix regulatory protein A
MRTALFTLGFSNIIRGNSIVAIINPESMPIKRLIANAKENGRLYDFTQGRRARAVVIDTSGTVILSSFQPQTIGNSQEKMQKSI